MTAAVPLGRLSRLDLRDVWLHEAQNFTPWLAEPENIGLLGATLHLGELQVEATEKTLGRFSADIVARDEAGQTVLIENQLEATDHRHLGQLLTYLAGLQSDATVIWIAAEFLDEHRAAVDWLNANTNERYSFFGVEVELVRIGESAPAPRFNIVAKPNDWSRGVSYVAQKIGIGCSQRSPAAVPEILDCIPDLPVRGIFYVPDHEAADRVLVWIWQSQGRGFSYTQAERRPHRGGDLYRSARR